MARDNFNAEVKRSLCERVGGICSNPSCQCVTTAPDPNHSKKRISIGQASHITAASEGGPRYDASLSAEERSSIENGIWLCDNCARLIDENPEKYNVYLLKGWKTASEEKRLRTMGQKVSMNSHIERHSDTYITLDSDDAAIGLRYCSRCFDVDGKLVQLSCHGGTYICPECKNNGIYDETEVIKLHRAMRKSKIISNGFEI